MEHQNNPTPEPESLESALGSMEEHLYSRNFEDAAIEAFRRALELLASLHEDEYLFDRLTLHGGFALALVHLGSSDRTIPRITMDVDFLYRQANGSKWEETREWILERLTHLLEGLGFRTEFEMIRRDNVKVVADFTTDDGLERSIDIEIALMSRTPLLRPGDTVAELRLPGTHHVLEVRVPVKEEAFAQKIVTLLNRGSSRDFLDVWWISKESFDPDLLRKCVLIIAMGDRNEPLVPDALSFITDQKSFFDEDVRIRVSKEFWEEILQNETTMREDIIHFLKGIFESFTRDELDAQDLFYAEQAVSESDKEALRVLVCDEVRRVVEALDPDNLLHPLSRQHSTLVERWLKVHTSYYKKKHRGSRVQF